MNNISQQDWGSESGQTHWSLKTGAVINEQNKGVSTMFFKYLKKEFIF